MSVTDPPATLIGGLLVGFVFGFLLQKGQVTKYSTIVGQFLFTDYTVLKVMLTAIVVGAVGVYGMLGLGLIEHLHVKPAMLAGVGVGGLIFGVGMSGLGYCPGTGVAAAAQGSRHAAVGVAGGVVGAALYTLAYPHLADGFLKLGDYGKVTLSDVTGTSPWVFVVGLAVIATVVFVAIGRWERRHPAAGSASELESVR
jgi:hypothetical protein